MATDFKLDFNNTSIAFKSKSNLQLKKANFLFTIMNNALLVNWGTSLATFALKFHLPVKAIIKSTIFSQFCGGETLQETTKVVNELNGFKVATILDYAAEATEGEASFDFTKNELLKVIDFAQHHNIPFISVKVTGIGSFLLLEKLHAKQTLSDAEQADFIKIKNRLLEICTSAFEKNICVLIDAEETWIQDPVDAMVNAMMLKFNKDKAIVYNTIQHYRNDRIEFLEKCIELSKQNNFILGLKLVRGAYMEKERERAAAMGYPSPINATKADTDNHFNQGVQMCLSNINHVSVFCASHNEHSAFLAAKYMHENNIAKNHAHVYFSQLYGMSDHITFNLANEGYNSCKYLPYGSVDTVMPYLIRRAQENTSIAGQMSRELKLIKEELNKR